MKKEKQVRSYKRRTKSGKTVTVKAHTAKYEAADEKAKEVSKKPGAGKELEERKKKPIQLELPFDKEEEKKVLDEVSKEDAKTQEKEAKTLNKKVASLEKKLRDLKYVHSGLKRDDPKKLKYAKKIQELQADLIATKKASSSAEKKTTKKVRPVGSGTNGPIPKEKKSEKKESKTSDSKSTSEPAFTAAEFKEWYRGTGSAADKKVAKALRAQLGRAGYRKLEDEAIDGYSARGHLSMFKRVSGGSEVPAKTSKSGAKEKAAEAKVSNSEFTQPPHSTKYKYKGETYYIKRKNVGGLIYKHTDVFNSKGEKLSKDEAAVIKAAQQKSAERADKRGDRRLNGDKEQMRLHGWADMGESTNKTNGKASSPKKQETSAELRKRADEMDAREKEAKITKKVGEGYKTIKNALLNNPRPRSRDASIRGNVYISSDGKTAYYEHPSNKGNLKKASDALLKRLTKDKGTPKTLENAKVSKNADTKKPSEKKPKREELSSVSGQVSYVRKLSKELPEDKRKVLAPLLRKASTGQISTHSLWNTYQKLNSKSKRYRVQPAPWDKRAFEDLANSD